MENETYTNLTKQTYTLLKILLNVPYISLNRTFSDFSTNLTTNDTTNQSVPRSSQDVSKYYPIIVAEMLLSCLCLIFSIVVYAVLPEFKNVHGKNLISMSGCLLTTFAVLILDLVVRNKVPFSFCFSMAMVIHVTFLATFFWTNVMAFDIWKSLTDMKAKGEVKGKSRKYLKYSIYAWTATIVTALPAAVLESTDLVSLQYRPQFGVRRCWLSGKTAFYYYFNLPVGAILLCNLIMFVLTLRKLILIKKMTAVLNVKQQQKRLNLYLKLFLVMGITWTTEFLPWVTGVYGLYALAGMLTALHGCFLFFIFVCKRKTLRNFYTKMGFGQKKDLATFYSCSSQQTVSTSYNTRKCSLDNLGDSKF